jgi:hypothetical protein
MIFDPKLGINTVAQETGAVLVQEANGLKYVGHSNRPAVQRFLTAQATKTCFINGVYARGISYRESLLNAFASVPKDKVLPMHWLAYYCAATAPGAALPHVGFEVPLISGDEPNASLSLTDAAITEYVDGVTADPIGTSAETAMAILLNTAYQEHIDARPGGSLDRDKAIGIAGGFRREDVLRDRLREAVAAIGSQPSTFRRHGALALEFFRRGICQAASIRFGGELQWDTTTDNFARQAALFESLFTELEWLLATATTAGIAERVCLVVHSERGRAPYLNSSGGKSVWPVSSVMVVGPGIKGGAILGGTDDRMRAVPINPLFGAPDGQNDVPLHFTHIVNALFLKYGLPYDVFAGSPPLSPILS